MLPHALRGFGGVGKTQLTVEFAYRFADRYDFVWWIRAEHQSFVLQSLADLAASSASRAAEEISKAGLQGG